MHYVEVKPHALVWKILRGTCVPPPLGGSRTSGATCTLYMCMCHLIYPGMCIYVSMHGICAHSYTCTYTIHTDLHTLYMYMYMYILYTVHVHVYIYTVCKLV